MMNRTLYLIILLLSLIELIPSANAQNNNYISNRAPLNEVPYISLPLGSIQAQGWLQKQLQLQKDGLTGYSETLYNSANDLGKDCDWLGGSGDSWERAPYYVKGLVALAYTLKDQLLINKAQKWIDWSLHSQDESGFFGPQKNRDWWARMPMLYAIKDYYEATKDKRVIPFLTKYFRYQLSQLDEKPMDNWGKARAGDNIEIAFWLYNHTGDAFLLMLADKLHEQAYDWSHILAENTFNDFGNEFYPKHNVNVPQGIKMPAIYYQKSNKTEDRNAYFVGSDHLMHDHGQPMGMQSGNEMLGGKSSLTGLEMCSIVEQMQSCETMQMILGDVAIGDQLEKVAFNALPGGVTKDFKGLQYYTQANQVKSTLGNHGFGQQYDNGLMPGPYSGYGCCRFNLHMGWPYFVKNMWAATKDNGLAAMAYGPSKVSALVGESVPVTVEEITNYPFEESLIFKISTKQQVKFPLKLRIPNWCKNPVIKVNGKKQKQVKSGEFYTITREWNNNDQVELVLPMSVSVNKEFNHSISVQRGPLVYALKMDESWIVKNDYGNGFKEYQVLPKSNWNYALVIDSKNPEKSISVNKKDMPENPFEQSSTPVTLTVNAKKTDDWHLALHGLTACDPPYSPIESSYPTEEIELVPFGAENIRVTCFPVLGNPDINSDELTEDFNDGNYEGWVEYGGSWMVKDKVLNACKVEGRQGSKAIETSTKFSDFVYNVKLKVNESGDGGVMFRASDVSLGADDFKGYYVGISAESKQIILGKSDGRWHLIKNVSEDIQKDKWYHLKVEATGSQIKVFLDNMNESKLEAKDHSFSKGMIGVRAYRALASWDDVHVIKSNLIANETSDNKENNDEEISVNKTFPELSNYPDGIVSQVYNSGPGMAIDQDAETTEDSKMLVVSNTSQATFTSYIDELQECGLTQISVTNTDDNVYYTLKSKNHLYYLYYTISKSQVRFIQDKSSRTLLSELDAEKQGTGSTEFYLYSLDYTHGEGQTNKTDYWKIDCGTLLIIKLKDNSLFLVDAGHERQSSDAALEGLMNFMYQITGQEEGSTINIRGWFYSHAHGDHVYMTYPLLEKYHQALNIESVLFNFPSFHTMRGGYDAGTFLMKKAINSYYPNCKYVKLHTGQQFSLQGVDFNVLFTHEDGVSSEGVNTIGNFNDTSTILSVTMDGKKIVLLGDTDGIGQANMLNMYSSETLKSDCVQTSHHGYNNVTPLYNAIKAPLVLFCNSKENAKDNNMNKYKGAKEATSNTIALFADPNTYKITVENGEFKTEAIPSYRDSIKK